MKLSEFLRSVGIKFKWTRMAFNSIGKKDKRVIAGGLKETSWIESQKTLDGLKKPGHTHLLIQTGGHNGVEIMSINDEPHLRLTALSPLLEHLKGFSTPGRSSTRPDRNKRHYWFRCPGQPRLPSQNMKKYQVNLRSRDEFGRCNWHIEKDREIGEVPVLTEVPNEVLELLKPHVKKYHGRHD